MDLSKLPAGKDLPHDFYAVVEIPAWSAPVKYEVDKETGALFCDRFVGTAMQYPLNYCFVNNTLALDGDPVDVLVLTPFPLQPGSVVRCRAVGVLKMTDDGGVDAKVLAVPHDKLTKQYAHIQDLEDFPKDLRDKVEHFFKHYKDLEPGKWVKVDGWEGKEGAHKELLEGAQRYLDSKK